MQRRKAITTAASISLALFSAATAMAVNTGLLLSPPPTGVGELNAVSADAIGPAPTTVPAPPAPPQTIIVTVPRSAVSGAPTAPPRQAPATVPSPTATSAPAPTATATSTTVRTPRPSTTVRGEDDDHDEEDEEDEEYEDEDDRPTTSTSRPSGGEDDD